MTGAIEDLRQRMFTKTKLERYSVMLVFHSTIKDLYPDMTEYCLVDLTYEATELAIIRGGALQYTTYTATGLNTLVRNLAARLDIPEGEATTLLKRAYDADSLNAVTATEKDQITALMLEYQEALEALFHETGDSLAIPKILFLHSSYLHERFFDDYITAAAKAATNSAHTVHTLSHELMLTQFTGEQKIDLLKRNIDTGVLMSALFFHKQGSVSDFTQL
jgi:Tfp pilus assembly PilM family ATPase